MKARKYKKLIFGIVGYGSIGKVHAKILKELGYKYFIYDPNFIKNKDYLPLKMLNQKCNTMIISSPNDTHLKYLNYFSDKNKHIFIEKPFSHEIKKTNKVIKIYEKNKKIIGVNYNLRTRKCIKFLKHIINKTKKIYWANFVMSSNVLNWRDKYNFKKNYTHKRKGGGIVFDSIHEIDLNTFLFKKINFINSFSKNHNKKYFKKNSYASINLLIDERFLSNIQLDYIGGPDQRKIEILSDIGLIKTDIKKNSLIIFDKRNRKKLYKKFNQDKMIDYKNMIINFINCIKKKKNKVICDPKDAIKNISIAVQANA